LKEFQIDYGNILLVMWMEKISSNIGQIIEKKGYKKRFVAEKMGITQTQLSNWISGRSYPSTPKLFKLAYFLDCKVDELYYFEGE
jgi:putative transcriptional regulator